MNVRKATWLTLGILSLALLIEHTPQWVSSQGAGMIAISLTIVIVYDDHPYEHRLKAAHGFSCLVRLPEKSILFDTGGDSLILLDNLRKLGIDPKEINIVVLSHIDWDHVGGLSGFLKQNGDVTVYLPQSFPGRFKDEVKSYGVKVEEVHEAMELLPGMYTTGELDGGIKEQSLVVRTAHGLAVVTGCAHPGVVKIVQKAKEIANDKVYLVLGGFHLGGASTSKIESIIADFKELGVEKVAPCHCSGDRTRQLFREHYGEDYIEGGVGKRITL
jgi:7,8-dihydropterin-6-yl-methyl-4-(beta-D-ribofuranosyl)aminobenzene 5'-phosphate synthase